MVPPIAHLSGTKKAKLIQALTNQADSFIQELWQNKMFEGQNKKNMVWHLMEQMDVRSTVSFNKLKTIISMSTQQLTKTMTRNAKTKNKTNNMYLWSH